MNQLSSLKYEYSNHLFRSILFEQYISKNFLVILFFVSRPSDLDLLSNLALKSQGKVYPFTKACLVDFTKYLTPVSTSQFYFRGIATHKCVFLKLPITSENLKSLSESTLHKNLPLMFVLHNGLYVNSFVSKLLLFRGLPYISNIVIIIFFCLQLLLRKLLSRFLLLNLRRKLV